MEMKLQWIGLGMVWALSALGQGTTNGDYRVMADKVNLRVRPDAGTEVIAQAQEGQTLSAVRVEGEWLGVVAPTNAGVWVKGQFVKAGVLTGDKIRLRCGPGIGYRDVGVLRKGAAVKTLEAHGEWLKIEPPADLVVWINRSLLEPVPAATNGPVATVVQTQEVVAVTAPVEVSTNNLFPAELPAGLTTDHLAPALGQGARVERVGTVERVPFAFFRGMDYRLVDVREGKKTTVCYLEGNDEQMPSLVGQRLKVKGRIYWLKDQRYAVVYPELITPVVE